jgi:hypothetical protein
MEGASIYLMSVRKINDLSGVAWAPYRGVVEGAFFDCTAFRSECAGWAVEGCGSTAYIKSEAALDQFAKEK